MGAVVTMVVQRHPTELAAAKTIPGARSIGAENTVPPRFVPAAAVAAAPVSTPAVSSQPSPPVEIAIPVIGVRSRLEGLRLDAAGVLQVPTNYNQAGWFSDGPAPGDPRAPAVIVGHVDSTSAPGIFYRLRDLRTGDAVLVRRADGTVVQFVVYKTAQFSKSGFPSSQVYGPTGRAELRLLTCTGSFDRATGHYLGNLVVYALETSAGGAGG